MPRLLIGLDGGGSKTVACLADQHQHGMMPLGRGVSGPSNLMTAVDETAFAHLEEAIDAAFQDAGLPRTQVESLCAAMAGSDRDPVRQRIRGWATGRIARTVHVVHDAEPLLAAVDRSTAAVALIAGTGSFAYGRAVDGRTARAGGWGSVLGDEGSAYWMGLEALRRWARALDGRLEGTSLFQQLERCVGGDGRGDLVSCVEMMNRPAIAALAVVVDQSADDGDPHALAICESAATHLTEIVSAVVQQLALPSREFALVVTGGVLLNRSVVSGLLRQQLSRVGLAPTSVSRCDDPAWGAVQIAGSLQQS